MVLFFAQKSAELLKTKLMKLLNYSDMIFYKENGISMSGLKYAHLPYGPVPDHFDMILGKMAADHIAHIEVFYDGAYEKHQVIPEREVPEGALSDAEIAVLNRVYEKLRILALLRYLIIRITKKATKLQRQEKSFRMPMRWTWN